MDGAWESQECDCGEWVWRLFGGAGGRREAADECGRE